MYFTNISNADLLHFHKVLAQNFSISLTNLLSSNLFKIETIITGSLYRICPLFYCKEITSSSDDDIILDSRVMIVTKKTDETYFNFISNPDDDIVVMNSTVVSDLDFYNLEDDLSVSEFNRIVQLLRYNTEFSEEIHMKNSTINGIYGDYVFDLESTTITDEGILVTQETLTELGTITLRNAMYEYSRYYLDLTVKSIEDVNITDDNPSSITTTEISVELEENEAVDIPFNTLDLDNVVLFDAKVRIDHSNSVVQYPTTLTASVNKSTIITGESVTFTCTYKDDSDDPIVGETIYLKHNNGTSISSSTTDSNGKVTFTYTPDSIGSENIICVDNFNNKSNLIILSVNSAATSLTLSTSRYETSVGEVFTLTGTLADSTGTGIANKTVKLYVNGEVAGTITTDSNGGISETHKFNSESLNALHLKFEAVGLYQGCTSNIIGISTFNPMTIVTQGDVVNNVLNGLQNRYGYPITIDWGDGTIETYTGSITHTYTDGKLEHTIQIKGCDILAPYVFDTEDFSSVTIPRSVTIIPDYCFRNNSQLNDINLPENLDRIGNYAFEGIRNCEIIIPQNVSSLGTGIFKDIENLDLYLMWQNPGEIPPFDVSIFGRYYDDTNHKWVISDRLTFYVPAGTIEYYMSRGYPSEKLVELGE